MDQIDSDTIFTIRMDVGKAYKDAERKKICYHIDIV